MHDRIRQNRTVISKNFRKVPNLNLQIMMGQAKISDLPKARVDDFEGRFREVLSDPSNCYIPRCENAGTVQDGHIIMHNGLKVTQDYYGEFINILLLNKGVHEPQEERIFMEVLKYIPPGATMIEIGAYWAFYSMWFQQQIPNAKNFMIEPDVKNANCGINNFKLNNMGGKFFLCGIGPHEEGGLDFIKFLVDNRIDYVDLLHMDIQGAELYLLITAQEIFAKKKVGYLFVSTHSQDIHTECIRFLIDHDYLILASADFDNETFCYDGIIVARDSAKQGLDPIRLDIRKAAPK
jgi:hypothetical protein